MTLSEISAAFIEYRKWVRIMHIYPDSETYQYMAAKAQARLVVCQAQYKGEVTI